MSTRRSVLAAALAGTSAASAGCLGNVRNIMGREESSQVTLGIHTTPADSDPNAIRIARHLASNLEDAGIDPRVNTMEESDLYRHVLLNHDFDLYVGQYPESEPFDPDALYPLCYSEFNSEPGWQNPFGFTDLAVDDLLLEQRESRDARRPNVVDDLQRQIVRQQPFITVAFPDQLTAVQDNRYRGWTREYKNETLRLLALDGAPDTPLDEGSEDANDEEVSLRLTTTDPRVTVNRNPIAAEYRRQGTFTGLMYDPLERVIDGERTPWLARSSEWADSNTVRIELRDVDWHDEEPLTAADVAFTYEFLADTSLGGAESPIPTSRFRGRSTLVEETAVVDESTIDVTLADINPTVGLRALTVPILPEHVWSEQSGLATIAGVEVNKETTDALVWDNPDPVGSGPMRFVEADPRDRVVFERNADHFLTAEPEGIPPELHGKPVYERLELEWVPSDIAAVQRVGDQLADATASNLGPDSVPRIGREADARLVSRQSAAFYHVGFNTRNDPLSNPHFRRAVARLIDKEWIVGDTFQGYARPASSPLAASPEWLADDLQFETEDPETPFLGEAGELNAGRVRDAFREIGYRYNEDGELLAREQ